MWLYMFKWQFISVNEKVITKDVIMKGYTVIFQAGPWSSGISTMACTMYFARMNSQSNRWNHKVNLTCAMSCKKICEKNHILL
jgi:hypothetical protein